MHSVLILGAGKIGRLAATLFADSGDYQVHLGDFSQEQLSRCQNSDIPASIRFHQLDVRDETAFPAFLKSLTVDAVVSCLPYHSNVHVARAALDAGCHYFDTTEDVKTANEIKRLAAGSKKAFVPQCGLAPGMINIIANDLMQTFDSLDAVFLRVGALPTAPRNALQYCLNWSTEGLINEYANYCHAIENGEKVLLPPLSDLETLVIKGVPFEAFNTSGGLGSLADTYLGKVKRLNYKTLRYPGHRDKMRFLMEDLKLSQDRPKLKSILENAIPSTTQDMVIIYVAVVGKRAGSLVEQHYVKRIDAQNISKRVWTAIQLTTASSLAAVVDHVLNHPDLFKGYITQETFKLKDIVENRFGACYAVGKDAFI